MENSETSATLDT